MPARTSLVSRASGMISPPGVINMKTGIEAAREPLREHVSSLATAPLNHCTKNACNARTSACTSLAASEVSTRCRSWSRRQRLGGRVGMTDAAPTHGDGNPDRSPRDAPGPRRDPDAACYSGRARSRGDEHASPTVTGAATRLIDLVDDRGATVPATGDSRWPSALPLRRAARTADRYRRARARRHHAQRVAG